MNELYQIKVEDTTYYITSGKEPVTIGSNTYNPGILENDRWVHTGISRSDIRVSGTDTGDSTVSIEMNRYHPAILHANRLAVLPEVSILNAEGRFLFRGKVNRPIELENRSGAGTARLEVVPIQQFLLRGNYQNINWQHRCNWALYSSTGCRVSRTRFSMTTTVTVISNTEDFGFQVRVASVRGIPALSGSAPFNYLQGGVIQRLSDSKRRHIERQSGTLLNLHNPFSELEVGDRVTLEAGCNRSFDHCRNKFNNAANFGGHHLIPFRNPANEIQRRS